MENIYICMYVAQRENISYLERENYIQDTDGENIFARYFKNYSVQKKMLFSCFHNKFSYIRGFAKY